MHVRRYSPCCRHVPDVLQQIMTHSTWCDSHFRWRSLCRLCLAARKVDRPTQALE